MDPVSCADVQLGTALFRNCVDVVPAVVTSTDRTVTVCNFVKFVTVPVLGCGQCRVVRICWLLAKARLMPKPGGGGWGGGGKPKLKTRNINFLPVFVTLRLRPSKIA